MLLLFSGKDFEDVGQKFLVMGFFQEGQFLNLDKVRLDHFLNLACQGVVQIIVGCEDSMGLGHWSHDGLCSQPSVNTGLEPSP